VIPEIPELEAAKELGGGVDDLVGAPGADAIDGGQLLLTVV
jgi:hypothetical protein